MPQLMFEPSATLIGSADQWCDEDWVVTPKNNSDAVRAMRAAGTSGNGLAIDRTVTAAHYGFVHGNRLVKDVVLGLYNPALIGGTSTLQTVGGQTVGWSGKSALANLLCTLYADVWLPDQNGKWVFFAADGVTVERTFDTLHDAISAVIVRIVGLLARNTEVTA